MNIELAPHIAKDGTVFDQFQVFATGTEHGRPVRKRIGYVGTAEGAPLILIARFSDAKKAEVKAEVERLKGAAVGRMAETPTLVDPPRDE